MVRYKEENFKQKDHDKINYFYFTFTLFRSGI